MVPYSESSCTVMYLKIYLKIILAILQVFRVHRVGMPQVVWRNRPANHSATYQPVMLLGAHEFGAYESSAPAGLPRIICKKICKK